MEWELMLKSLGELPRLLQGVVLTVELVVCSVVAGFALAIPLALARLSRNPLLWVPAYGFIFLFRGTPILVQVYLIYYGLGQFESVTGSFLWPVLREAWWCAVLTFTLNTAAYQGEILRGAILGVPHGEVEAARACGMSGALLFRRVVLPRALRIAMPALGNEIILMLKASAIVSLITMMDLMGVTRALFARTYAIELFFYAGVLYLCMTFVFTRVWGRLERHMSRHLAPRSAPDAG